MSHTNLFFFRVLSRFIICYFRSIRRACIETENESRNVINFRSSCSLSNVSCVGIDCISFGNFTFFTLFLDNRWLVISGRNRIFFWKFVSLGLVGNTFWGAITPIGGIFWILGWSLMCYTAIKHQVS